MEEIILAHHFLFVFIRYLYRRLSEMLGVQKKYKKWGCLQKRGSDLLYTMLYVCIGNSEIFLQSTLYFYGFVSYLFYSSSTVISMLAWIGQFLMNDFQAFLSLARSLLTFSSCRSFLIASLLVFRDCPLDKLLSTSEFRHLLYQTIYFIFSR